MISKKKRLTREEFTQAFKSAKVFRTDHFLIRCCEISKEGLSSGIPKCSVVVSKKVAKKAPERKLLKRYVYTALRELGFETKKRHMIFIIKAKTNVLGLSYQDIKQEISDFLEKI